MAEEESSFPEPVVLHADMPKEIQAVAFEKARSALSTHRIEKDQAAQLKRQFEEAYKGTWHAIVGKSFGCSVTNETGYLIFFRIGKVNILLFQSLDEEAPASGSAA
jgi:dynein light chain LC8-type